MTLWGRIVSGYDTSLKRLKSSMYQIQLLQSMFGTMMSPLVTRTYLQVVKDTEQKSTFSKNILATEDNYVFTENFYKSDVDTMTTLEKMVYLAITQKNVKDTKALIDMMYAAIDSEDDTMFYIIPVLLYLESVAHARMTILK